jgi:hypothetical protein
MASSDFSWRTLKAWRDLRKDRKTMVRYVEITAQKTKRNKRLQTKDNSAFQSTGKNKRQLRNKLNYLDGLAFKKITTEQNHYSLKGI